MSTKATGVTVVLMVIMPSVAGYHLGLSVVGSGTDLEPSDLILLLGSSGASTFCCVSIFPLMSSGDLQSEWWVGSWERIVMAMQGTELPESAVYVDSEWHGEGAFIPRKSVGFVTGQCHRAVTLLPTFSWALVLLSVCFVQSRCDGFCFTAFYDRPLEACLFV